MNRVPFDVERDRARRAQTVFDPGWAERPTFIDSDGTIVLQGWPLYRCVGCGRQHVPFTTKVCPCGVPFPYDKAQVIYR